MSQKEVFEKDRICTKPYFYVMNIFMLFCVRLFIGA